MHKALIASLITLLLVYVVLFQFYIYAEFTGSESFATESLVKAVWWPLIFVHVVVLILNFKDINMRNIQGKSGWKIYMLITGGIGCAHYFFKHIAGSKNAL